jgi:hypothetical protein
MEMLAMEHVRVSNGVLGRLGIGGVVVRAVLVMLDGCFVLNLLGRQCKFHPEFNQPGGRSFID